MIGFGQALTFLIGSLVNWRTLALIGHLFIQLVLLLIQSKDSSLKLASM